MLHQVSHAARHALLRRRHRHVRHHRRRRHPVEWQRRRKCAPLLLLLCCCSALLLLCCCAATLPPLLPPCVTVCHGVPRWGSPPLSPFDLSDHALLASRRVASRQERAPNDVQPIRSHVDPGARHRECPARCPLGVRPRHDPSADRGARSRQRNPAHDADRAARARLPPSPESSAWLCVAACALDIRSTRPELPSASASKCASAWCGRLTLTLRS
jgi:hypothetical protein